MKNCENIVTLMDCVQGFSVPMLSLKCSIKRLLYQHKMHIGLSKSHLLFEYMI